MKREEFYRAMNDKRRPDHMPNEIKDKIIGLALKNPKNNCICMEELAELMQQISKFERGFGDRTALLEEMADVMICMALLAEEHHITPQEFEKAESIKLQRVWTKNGGKFQDLYSNSEGSVKNWIL